VTLLLLKVLLVPSLIGAVTVGSRRWGPRIGGWLNALPLVAGPVLFFMALEQGEVFVARAAAATLAGLVGVATFSLAYAWIALRSPWWASLAAGWTTFGITTALLQTVSWHPLGALAAALASFAAAWGLLPSTPVASIRMRWPSWDLPLRMGAAVGLVLVLTGLAASLGPRLSGALTPFPVATAILLAFTHAQQGAPGALWFLRGFLPAMWSFAGFCFVLTLAALPLGRDLAFLGALAVQLATQGLVLLALRVLSR
jgi:hypothetical protein